MQYLTISKKSLTNIFELILLTSPITLPTREVMGKLAITIFYDITSTETRKEL